MFTTDGHAGGMQKTATRIYKAYVRPCSVDRGRFRWAAVAYDGGHTEHALKSYPTAEAAQSAGDARARALTNMGYNVE